jgi:excisionase family DNA binding protein
VAYSIGEAAKAVGVSKSTLSRAIKNGRVSATKKDDGSFSIDPAELHRVYPPVSSATGAKPSNDAPRNTPETADRTEILEVQLAALREQLRDRDETIADLRRRLDESESERRESHNRVVALLTHQPQNQPSSGFWSRIRGRRTDSPSAEAE